MAIGILLLIILGGLIGVALLVLVIYVIARQLDNNSREDFTRRKH